MSDKYTLAVIVTIAFLVVINVVCNWDYFFVLLTFAGVVSGAELLHGLVRDLVDIYRIEVEENDSRTGGTINRDADGTQNRL